MGTNRHDPPRPQRAGVASDRIPVTTEQEVSRMGKNTALMATSTRQPSVRSDHAETEPGGCKGRPAHLERITQGSHQPEDAVVVLP